MGSETCAEPAFGNPSAHLGVELLHGLGPAAALALAFGALALAAALAISLALATLALAAAAIWAEAIAVT